MRRATNQATTKTRPFTHGINLIEDLPVLDVGRQMGHAGRRLRRANLLRRPDAQLRDLLRLNILIQIQTENYYQLQNY